MCCTTTCRSHTANAVLQHTTDAVLQCNSHALLRSCTIPTQSGMRWALSDKDADVSASLHRLRECHHPNQLQCAQRDGQQQRGQQQRQSRVQLRVKESAPAAQLAMHATESHAVVTWRVPEAT